MRDRARASAMSRALCTRGTLPAEGVASAKALRQEGLVLSWAQHWLGVPVTLLQGLTQATVPFMAGDHLFSLSLPHCP